MNVYVPSSGPADWQKLLAEPEKHWRPGFSAQSVAQSWEAANGVPPEIDRLFGGGLELLLAIPEHQVHLRGGRRPSQCDVFALLRQGDQTISMAVEGKVDEPFGPILAEWLVDASNGKRDRLEHIKSSLQLTGEVPTHLHYQLLHRTAAAVIEARRFKTDIAAMVVQSFSPTGNWFEAFAQFASYLGMELKPGQLGTVRLDNLLLKIGWVAGDQVFREKQASQRPDLYERDFYAWTQEQAVKLRTRAHDDIDWENVAEEIESLGRSDKREIGNRLEVLIRHVLKWEYQPEKRKVGWQSTIREQRWQVGKLIKESPSLRNYPATATSDIYGIARMKARDETGMRMGNFPETCPYLVDQILDEEFYPGEPLERGEDFFDN